MLGKLRSATFFTILLAMAAGSLLADGMIVPVRPDLPVRGSWSVKYHHVDMVVRDGAASVSVDQEFVNNSRQMIEVEYLFPVPPGAAIDSMTLIVAGKEFEAELLEAKKAREIYEEIVRRKKDPALMEYAGFGLYKTRAFPLEKGKPARVQVHYDYIPGKNFDISELNYPLNTEKFSAGKIESVKIRADIKAAGDICGIYSPTHDYIVDRRAANHVIVSYEDENIIPTNDFQLFYRTSGKEVSASLLTYRENDKSDAFALAIISPGLESARKEAKSIPKDIVIVLDRSGSMSGEKIEQARDSANFILSHLNEADRFNVISYSGDVNCFAKSLQLAEPKSAASARDMLERIRAGGSTDIHAALTKAMGMFSADPERARYIIFLTDGLASSGVTDTEKIVSNVTAANKASVRLFGFGVGYDVNVKLMDKLSGKNSGMSDYVKPQENIESKIAALYKKVRNPVMTNVEIKFPFDVVDTYPRQLRDLFDGDSIVIAARVSVGDISRRKKGKLIVSGDYLGERKDFEFLVNFDWSDDVSHSFVQRIWATRRVGHLLDMIQLNGENKELTDELVALSIKYGIITPYTSFLAREDVNLAKEDEVNSMGASSGRDLSRIQSGAGAQRSAVMRGQLKSATKVAPMAAPGARMGMVGNSSTSAYEDGEVETVENVRQTSNSASYSRGDYIVAANASDIDLKEEDSLKQAERVEKFSEKYFQLTRENTPAENQFFASQGEGKKLLIRLRGKLYLIE